MAKMDNNKRARNKVIMRERDRERKRMKRLNPEYRRMEQEKDRERKKARRANEAFRPQEKDTRKECKKGFKPENSLVVPTEFGSYIPPVPLEPEIIISDNPVHLQEEQQPSGPSTAQQQPAGSNQQQQQQAAATNPARRTERFFVATRLSCRQRR